MCLGFSGIEYNKLALYLMPVHSNLINLYEVRKIFNLRFHKNSLVVSSFMDQADNLKREKVELNNWTFFTCKLSIKVCTY